MQRHRRDLVRNLDERVGNISGGGAERGIDELRLFLQREVLPLAEANELYLGPAFERVSGRTLETSSMLLDCEVARRYVNDVQEIMYKLETRARKDEREQLEAHLVEKAIRLQAIVELLVERESRIYLPLLEEHFSEEERSEILRAMVEGHRVIRLPNSERV
jgi:hypothetical protein